MKLSLLQSALNNDLSIQDFKNMIQIEVEEYRQKLKKTGVAVSIIVEEDVNLYFKNSDLVKICEYYLDGTLTPAQISYISDCLTLSEKVVFERNELFDILEELTDPKVNGEIFKKRVDAILKRIE
jgi:hypothetical protein